MMTNTQIRMIEIDLYHHLIQVSNTVTQTYLTAKAIMTTKIQRLTNIIN